LQAASFAACIEIRHLKGGQKGDGDLKGGFSTLIHIYVQNNFICYAFEGHVARGPHPALGIPVGQPWCMLSEINFIGLQKIIPKK